MEKKIQYSVSRLMMLFIVFTVVSAKVSNPSNLYTVVYVGDTNVTVGKPFWIQCLSDRPIDWHKDGQRIQQMHIIRHSKEDYSYKQHDELSDDSRVIKSTISVKHALKMHSGKYKCNLRHDKSHMLYIHDSESAIVELDSDRDSFEDDYEEVLDTKVSFIADDALKSTMMMYVSEATKLFDESYEQVREELDVAPTTTERTVKHKINHKVSLPTIKHKATLSPVGQNKKLYTITKPLILKCEADDPTKIVWMKDDQDVREIKEIKDHIQINAKKGELVIEKSREMDAGNYSCNLDSESHAFEVWAQVLVKIPQNTYVVENDKLEVTCVVRGTNPVISWYFSNTTADAMEEISPSNDRVKLEMHDGIENSRLIIDHVLLSDHGTYYCNGTNKFMEDLDIEDASSDGLVRVKGKLAALWPFLGICAEVFILCTIILIYEKRRNKTDLDESDTDQSPDQKNDHHIKDSDVRQRK